MSSRVTDSENVLEVVPDALVGIDQAGVIRFVNYETESLFGCDRDDLIGGPIQMLVPEHLWEVYSQHREDYFADPLSRSMGLDLELVGRRRDGTRFPVVVSLSVIDTGDVLLVITSALKVTNRKRAFENAQRMTAIVANSEDAIVGKTLNGIVTSWSPGAERMYGYSSQEIIGKSIHKLSPQDRTGEICSILAKIRTGQPVEHLKTIRIRKDGSRFPVSLSVVPIHEEDGGVVGASVIGRDMTERTEMFEVAQRMAALVQFSGEALVGGTLEGIITSCSPGAGRMFGYGPQEMIGMSGRLLLSEDRATEAVSVLARIRAGQQVEHFETGCVRKDGTVFSVSLSVAPIRDLDGAIIGLYAVAHEMSGRAGIWQFSMPLRKACSSVTCYLRRTAHLFRVVAGPFHRPVSAMVTGRRCPGPDEEAGVLDPLAQPKFRPVRPPPDQRRAAPPSQVLRPGPASQEWSRAKSELLRRALSP